MDEQTSNVNNQELITCSNCGKQNVKDNNNCMFCGASLNEKTNIKNEKNINQSKENNEKVTRKEDEVFCTNCGKINKQSNKFCTNCGATLDEITSTSTENDNSTYNDINKETQKEKEDKSLAITLAIITIIVVIVMPSLFPLALIVGMITFFSKKTKTYGKIVLGAIGGLLITGILLFLILLGLCFGAF